MNILEILEDVNNKVDWEEILNNIEDWVKEYYDAIAKSKLKPEEYLKEVLPEYWQVVRALNIHRWGEGHLPTNSCYDVGIFLVGFSSLPIALSIAEIQPRQKIYFIHSDDTAKKCDEITDRIEEMLVSPPLPFHPLIDLKNTKSLIARVKAADRCQITDASDPVSTFQQIKTIIDSIGKDVKIALDLTGGKKTMIGGGFTAGSIYSVSPKCDMFYVDSLEYDRKRGVPAPGTEFLSQLENPYDVYNVQSVTQAKELYKRHNYEAAERLWQSIQNKLDRHAKSYHFLANEREEAKKYCGSSYCYYPWDALDYETAVRRKTYQANKKTRSWGYDAQHVHRGIDVLGILAEVRDRATLFAKEYRVIHYAIDRYQNGMRRKQSGKLEDALVRFTQVIEMLCNYRIYRLAQDGHFIKIGSSDPKHELPRRLELTPVIRLLFGTGSIELKGDNYHVRPNKQLEKQDYGYASIDQIIDVIQPRHNFIHFNNPMRQQESVNDVNNLRELALKFLENFSKGYCCSIPLDFEDLLELHKFRR